MKAYEKPLELTDDEYKDVLNDIYPDVTICGMEYSQGDILAEIDPVAFRCGKNDYEVRNDSGVWVCGTCESEYDSEGEAEECCKVDRLCELLESLGYKGTDASTEESIIEYGLVCNPSKDGSSYHCILSLDNGEKFDHTDISLDDIQDAINDMENGFFDFIDTKREDYTLDKVSIPMIIQDIRQYNGVLTDTLDYDCSIDDIITMLENDIKKQENEA